MSDLTGFPLPTTFSLPPLKTKKSLEISVKPKQIPDQRKGNKQKNPHRVFRPSPQ